MRKSLFTLTIFILATGIAHSETPYEQAIKKTRAMTTEYRQEMSRALKLAMEADWYTAAITLCEDVAPNVAMAVGAQHGGEIHTVSLKYSSSNGKPDEFEKKILVQMERDLSEGKLKAAYRAVFVNEDGHRSFRLMKPIIAGKICLGCHGTKEVLHADALKSIEKKYLYGIATGYEIGEIRGAYTVSYPLD